MSKPTIHYLRRQHAQGVPMRRLCEDHDLSMSELREILGMPKVTWGRRKAPSDREKAIEDLRNEGYSEDVIRANFGEIQPPTQAEWDNAIGDGA